MKIKIKIIITTSYKNLILIRFLELQNINYKNYVEHFKIFNRNKLV